MMRLLYLVIVLVSFYATTCMANKYEVEEDNNEIQQAEAYASPEQLFDRGIKYYQGIGVKKNERKAVQFFEASAAMGNEKARSVLSNMKTTDSASGRNDVLDEQVTNQAANHGDANAEYSKGMRYLLGEEAADYKTALVWLKRAALKNHAEAQNELGYMYMAGLGVPQDYKQSFQWYERSAKQGVASAQYNVGLIYEYGLGMPVDHAKAKSYFKLAAEHGFSPRRG